MKKRDFLVVFDGYLAIPNMKNKKEMLTQRRKRKLGKKEKGGGGGGEIEDYHYLHQADRSCLFLVVIKSAAAA